MAGPGERQARGPLRAARWGSMMGDRRDPTSSGSDRPVPSWRFFLSPESTQRSCSLVCAELSSLPHKGQVQLVLAELSGKEGTVRLLAPCSPCPTGAPGPGGVAALCKAVLTG